MSSWHEDRDDVGEGGEHEEADDGQDQGGEVHAASGERQQNPGQCERGK